MTQITHAEMRIVRLVARGLSNKEIATTTETTERNVKSHLTHVMRKAGLTSRYQLIIAYMDGLIEETP